MSTKNQDSEINSILSEARQLHRELLAAGYPEELLDNPPPMQRRLDVSRTLVRLADISDAITEAMGDKIASGALPIVGGSEELWHYYDNEIHPHRSIFRQISGALLFGRSVVGLPEPDPEKPKGTLSDWLIAATNTEENREDGSLSGLFETGLNLLQYQLEDHTDSWGYVDEELSYDNEDLSRLWGLLSMGFFAPDNWYRNINDLRPIISARPEQNFPVHVRVRLKEIYRSFIMENWLSTLALARSLLEYVLIDRSNNFGVAVRENDHGSERTRRLWEIIEDYGEVLPSVKDSMDHVRSLGNHVMHPNKNYDVVKYPNIMRRDALDCINRLRDVLAAVYSTR